MSTLPNPAAMPPETSTVRVTLADAAATRAAGLALGRALPAQALVLLTGEMGAGKTTLAKAVCEALGVAPYVVTSPTYTLVNVYPRAGGGSVYHVDLYRMERPEALLDMDRNDWLHPEGVTLMEWPDAARPLIGAEPALEIHLAPSGTGRVLEASGDSAVYGAALAALRTLPPERASA